MVKEYLVRVSDENAAAFEEMMQLYDGKFSIVAQGDSPLVLEERKPLTLGIQLVSIKEMDWGSEMRHLQDISTRVSNAFNSKDPEILAGIKRLYDYDLGLRLRHYIDPISEGDFGKKLVDTITSSTAMYQLAGKTKSKQGASNSYNKLGNQFITPRNIRVLNHGLPLTGPMFTHQQLLVMEGVTGNPDLLANAMKQSSIAMFAAQGVNVGRIRK